MLFLKESKTDKNKVVFGIQITLANKHPIWRSAYELFYEKLGLDSKTDKVTIYITYFN